MYLDSVGKVTVGVGLMLPNVAAACALGFTAAGAAASAEQIAAEYARVAALAPDKVPAFYRAETSPTAAAGDHRREVERGPSGV